MAALAPSRVRFAPSPTGRLHLGGGRTALYDFLIARQSGGQFILRLEDTDTRRYVPGAEQEIIDGLHWLGMDWDEGFDIGGPYGPYRQSQRRDQYALYTRQLIEGGHAYPCFCTPERLEKMRQDAEQTCAELGLAYRIKMLCTGDLGFGARKTYDIEVWAPGVAEWLEVSSVSNVWDFQARRANIKYRPQECGKTRLVV